MFLSTTAFIIFPIMAGLAGVSTNLVEVILGSKWLPSVPLIRIFCISFGINVFSNANMQPFNAIGRSDVFLKFEMIKRSISIILLLIVALSFKNIVLVACVVALMGFVSVLMNASMNKKLLNYRFIEQITDVLPVIIISLIMFIAVHFVGKFLCFSSIINLVIQILLGLSVYLLLCFIFKVKSLNIIFNVIKDKLSRKKA